MVCLIRIVWLACIAGHTSVVSLNLQSAVTKNVSVSAGVRVVKVTASARTSADDVDGIGAAAVRRVVQKTSTATALVSDVKVSAHAQDDVVSSEIFLETGAERVNDSFELRDYWRMPGSELINDEPFRMCATYHLRHIHNNLDLPLAGLVEVSEPGALLGGFYAKTGMVVIVAFALTFLYGQWHEFIAQRTGLTLAHVCCIIYASLSISIDLSIKNAAEAYGGSFPFNPACGVVVVECAKLISALLFLVHVRESMGRGEAMQRPTLKDVGCLAVPAAIYATNNLIVFQAIKMCPLSTFGVIRETMLIWNAFIWTATFRQSISAKRWLCLFGIFFGCSANQIPKMLNDEFSIGVLWACLLALTNAAGAVANEYAMKQKAQLDINLQNSILYGLCGSFVLLGIVIFSNETVQSAEVFFTGFVPECWTIIVLQVFTGLAVSRILKYVESVTKTIVAAIRGPGVIFLGAIIFHKELHASEVFATLCVCTACWVYLREGPLTQPKALAEGK